MNTLSKFFRVGFNVCFALCTFTLALADAPIPQVAVESIVMSTSQSEQGTSATATVTVLDNAGQPVCGAMVTSAWTGLTAAKGSALTNRQGKATFHTARVKGQGVFSFDIRNIAAAGATYDATLNKKSHETVACVAADVSHVTAR